MRISSHARRSSAPSALLFLQISIGPLPLARRLRFCRSGRRSLRWRRSVLFLEVNFWNLPRAFVGLEVGVVSGKSAHTCNYVVREERNIGVVVLQRLVIATPLHRDAVFGASEFVLQTQEVFV